MRPMDFNGEFRCSGHYYRMRYGEIIQEDTLDEISDNNDDDDDDEVLSEQSLQIAHEVSNEPVFDNLGIVAIISMIIYLFMACIIVMISVSIRKATTTYAKFTYIRNYGSQVDAFAILDDH